jgi:hypothetical protein
MINVPNTTPAVPGRTSNIKLMTRSSMVGIPIRVGSKKVMSRSATSENDNRGMDVVVWLRFKSLLVETFVANKAQII